MKKFIATTLAIAVTAFTFSAIAQPSNSNDTEFQKGERMHKGKRHKGPKLLEKINLSDEQKTQIEAIRANYKPQLQNIRENGKAFRGQKKDLDAASSDYVNQVQSLFAQSSENRAQAVTLRAQMKHEVALVLTAEQRAELKSLKEEFKSKRGERRKGRRGGKRQQGDAS